MDSLCQLHNKIKDMENNEDIDKTLILEILTEVQLSLKISSNLKEINELLNFEQRLNKLLNFNVSHLE